MLKKIIQKIIIMPLTSLSYIYVGYEKLIRRMFPQLHGIARQVLIDLIDSDKNQVRHENTKFWLYTPNKICNFRHSTFSTKEPEMLEWIEEYGGEGAFYDIGANIGIYSLYYAKTQQGNVFSFEPSVFNLRQLAKNLSINKMDGRVTIISNPLTNKTGISSFTNGNTDEGGALSAFGVDYGHDGKPIDMDIKYSVVGFSLDDLLESGAIKEMPSIIKIDVDGIEHLILKGATKTLSISTLKSIFIEVNDDFEEQSAQVKTILESAGFKLKEKRHSEIFEGSAQFGSTYNQIWIRA